MNPNVLENLDYDVVFERLKDDYIAKMPASEQADWQNTLMLQSEPVTKLLELIAYLEIVLRNRVNEAAKANLLSFAQAGDLDRLADFYGVARADGEDDARFKSRIVNRVQGSSTAGPMAHYRHHAMSASPLVDDVYITSPRAGEVLIVVLSRTDVQQATQAVKDKVMQDDVKVLTDFVTVEQAVSKVIDVHAKIRLKSNNPTTSLTITNDLHALFSKAGLGQTISLSAIIARLHNDDVMAVELLAPTGDVQIKNNEIPQIGQLNLEWLSA